MGQPKALLPIQSRPAILRCLTTLLGSVWRTLCASGITVQIVFGESQLANGRDRRDWAADLKTEIEQLRRLPAQS